MSARRMVVVPVTLEGIEVVQAEFDAWWAGLADENSATRYAFETAVVEIATNIVEHTQRVEGNAGRHFTLELDGTTVELLAVFTDDGMPADIDLSTVTMADLEQESGRGLALALAALDRLDYRHVGGRNIWTLVCGR